MGEEVTTIAVVGGTGAEGSAIALRLGHAGYRVIIGTRDTSKAARISQEQDGILGRAAIQFATNDEAVRAAQLVILTVPYNVQISIVKALGPTLEHKILIDATVPLLPPKVSSVQLPSGGSAVAIVQQTLGDKVRVILAFQNVAAHKLRDLDADIGCDVLVCGDNAAARALTLELIAKMRLRGLDAGPICNSAAAEALTSILIFLNRKYKVQRSGIKITGLDDTAAAR
jgi:NADPH-dependent F420 reductase